MALTKVLIVDDSADFRGMVKDYLKMHDLGFEIFEASTGEMGVAKAACVRPDIVLMDIHLPHSSGLEAAKHIKGDNPQCDVIILTMFEVDAFKQAAKNISAVDFIGKSEIYERLLPSINKCLTKKQGEINGRKPGKRI